VRGRGWKCGLCHVESNIVLRSREIQNVCMSCDIKVKSPEVRNWLRDRFGILVFDSETGSFKPLGGPMAPYRRRYPPM